MSKQNRSKGILIAEAFCKRFHLFERKSERSGLAENQESKLALEEALYVIRSSPNFDRVVQEGFSLNFLDQHVTTLRFTLTPKELLN
ncbi:hypothetical protein K7432_002354 [Basidiobolus ranarum]|uniref:Uncharacterized protein n=1 Tax=Basidiobolus ranarum TaxID=34480 RepID=A0ABR2X1M4_9FUNG